MKRICKICDSQKDLEEFPKDKRLYQGRKYQCRQCVADRTKIWKDKNKDKLKQHNDRYRKKVADVLLEYRTPCVECGESDPCVIDFHHVDPSKKSFSIGRKRNSIPLIIKEIEKCVCLCANCHRKLHAGRFELKKRNPQSS